MLEGTKRRREDASEGRFPLLGSTLFLNLHSRIVINFE